MEFTGRVLGDEAWHERYSGFRGELVGLLGLGLQKWLSKGPSSGLAYISSQVGDCFDMFNVCLPSSKNKTRNTQGSLFVTAWRTFSLGQLSRFFIYTYLLI